VLLNKEGDNVVLHSHPDYCFFFHTVIP